MRTRKWKTGSVGNAGNEEARTVPSIGLTVISSDCPLRSNLGNGKFLSTLREKRKCLPATKNK